MLLREALVAAFNPFRIMLRLLRFLLLTGSLSALQATAQPGSARSLRPAR